MDVLIGLIVWLLRQLFGETEKTADMDDAAKRRGAKPRTVRTPGNAPSLEELLAEVRREAEQKRRVQTGEAAEIRPTPRPQQQARTQPSPRPTIQPETEPSPAPRRELETREFKSAFEVAPVPEPARPSPEIIASLSDREVKAIDTPVDISQPRKRRQKVGAAAKQAEATGVKAPAGAAIAEMIQAIRQGSSSERREITQQAFVLNEIFGPCRCHKRYTPPPRV